MSIVRCKVETGRKRLGVYPKFLTQDAKLSKGMNRLHIIATHYSFSPNMCFIQSRSIEKLPVDRLAINLQGDNFQSSSISGFANYHCSQLMYDQSHEVLSISL